MIAPLIAGCIAGGIIFALFRWRDMLRDVAPSAVVLGAIAVFWPVFAIDEGSATAIAIHTVVAGAFLVVAAIAVPKFKWLVAVAIAAHGLFDVAQMLFLEPVGPAWWPSFCGGLDIVLGGCLFLYWCAEKQQLGEGD